MKRMPLSCVIPPVWLMLFIGPGAVVDCAADEAAPAALSPDEASQLFARQIGPLLQQKCLGCHGDGEELESDLDLRSRQAMLRGGATEEPALVPGDPEESLLFQAVLRTGNLVMPPKERNRLNDEEIESLRRWIAAGAPWPDADEAAQSADTWDAADGVALVTSGGLSPDWDARRYALEDLWAYRPLKRPDVPSIGPSERSSDRVHPIDAFIDRRLTENNLQPAGAADRGTWLRRATFDLIGLPPTPAEIDAFARDNSPEAERRAIDRLLASSHYGERMAQHWLDVVRYADTGGFSNDYERPHAWRYRDYVIRSFNDDKPFNRFIVEQIAGDELEPDHPEMRIAVGMLRMGPWEQTGMSVAAITRQQFLDDVTNSIGESFLAQGLSCCRCHDHKFDPLPTRDYYRMQAALATTEFDEPATPFLEEENTRGFDVLSSRIARMRDAPDWLTTEDPQNDSVKRLRNKRREYLDRAAQRYQPQSYSVKNGAARPMHILLGGSLESPGDAVEPGVLSAMSAGSESVEAPKIPQSSDGRRLALARWIASDENTLTARVIVNRVWQWHFGRGLVATSNNFGKMGARPTHPLLLDWLAAWFIEHDWSLKGLHRLIMTSDVYSRSGVYEHADAVARIDPQNQLLAYFPPRRLSAEEIRDAMLSCSGELNPELGGPGVFPEINWEAALQPRHIMGAIAPAYQPSRTPAERNRRTVYAFRMRTLAHPMLEVFNQPASDSSCQRRDQTTVTPQVFAMFNGHDVYLRALAMADRLVAAADDDRQRIEMAYRLAYGRPPTDGQRRDCLQHVEAMRAHHQQHPPEPLPLPGEVTREMIDEQTGRPFQWREKLSLMDQYQADLGPDQFDARTRAWAELCLVLLNSNEFMYVY